MTSTFDLFANDLFENDSQQEKKLPFLLPNAEGYSAVWNEQLQGFDIAVPNGELFYAEHFFNQQYADKCINYFMDNKNATEGVINWREIEGDQLAKMDFTHIQWQHDKLTMYGKVVYLPRYSAWYGDNDKPYTYSGLTLQPKAWNKGLLDIKQKIEQVAAVTLNSVLMNWYRDGSDYISWHTDAEKELGKNPLIASANFGETRRFLIRRKDDHAIKLELPLKHGTLLIMKGELQHFWQHCVPKETKVKGSRFNLTFRSIN